VNHPEHGRITSSVTGTVTSYERLERDERKARRLVDHSATWAKLSPITSVNGTTQTALERFCMSKHITIGNLDALGTRVRIHKSGTIELAFAGAANDAGAIVAVKFRPIGASSHDSYALNPSTWLRPIVAGRPDALEWFVAEGETDGARLVGFTGARAAVMVLPAGARMFRREWANIIPRGATVYLAHDADNEGDAGAAKAAKVIGRGTVRLRPPEGDWCDFTGSVDDFIALGLEARTGSPTGLVATPLKLVEMRSIEWLERPLWQRSAFQLLAGAKGSGKGTYLAGFASRISRAGQNVIFIATEDSTSIDLLPRLVAAGAVIDRCYCIEQHVRLPGDIDELRELALGVGEVGLLVIDPVANHIGDSDSNSEAAVRHAIGPLNALADDLACLLIGVRHPGKDRSRGALASILGSTAWVDTPRAVVMIAVDDEDDLVRHIQVVAGNRSLNGSAQMFRIDAVEVEGLAEPITKAVDLGVSMKTIDELLAGGGDKSDAGPTPEEIQEIILEELKQGEKARFELDAACMTAFGVSSNTVYRMGLEPLRKEDQITARKDGLNGRWYWRKKELF
jgi:hypothetical protein